MLKLIRRRRSCRKFKSKSISKRNIDKLLKAALWSPTSKNKKPCEFITISDKATLKKLAKCKPHGASMLETASHAIVVIANNTISDAWIEDASIASILIQMEAEALKIGSCWVQIRKRDHNDSITAEEYIQKLLSIPKDYKVESIIALGYKTKKRTTLSDKDLNWHKTHTDKFQKH